jgi:cobalt/nickel transport system permease protein
MHMADALLSPPVGAALWAITAGAIAGSAKLLKNDLDDCKLPLMGVLAAFVFAVQMINFTIPGTGSSGHLGGGLLLAVLLGSAAALIAMASVLTVQALFFADGGLLALGCNIFNLAVLPCFVAYPLIYRRIAGRHSSRQRILVGSLLAAIAGLQLGAFGVVLQTVASGVSELPIGTFALLMQPIHLAIGVVEGVVTAAVVTFIWQARPEVLDASAGSGSGTSWKGLLAALAAATVLTAGGLSWFASTQPDGLEWAIARVTDGEELAEPHGRVYSVLSALQEGTALFPDYGFRVRESAPEAALVDAGTSLAGLVGGLLTLAFVGLTGVLLKKRRRQP